MTVRKKRGKTAFLLCTEKDRAEFVVRNIPCAAHRQPCSSQSGSDRRDSGRAGLSTCTAPHRSMKTRFAHVLSNFSLPIFEVVHIAQLHLIPKAPQ